MTHQSRFQPLHMCLVVGQLLAIVYGAEIMTAGIAGGGGEGGGDGHPDRRPPNASQPSALTPATPAYQSMQQPSSSLSTGATNLSGGNSSNAGSAGRATRQSGEATGGQTIHQRQEEASRDAKDAFSAWSAGKYVNKPNNYDRKALDKRFGGGVTLPTAPDQSDWQCPGVSSSDNLECSCDLPHTLRCSGDLHGLEVIADSLRRSPYSVSLLDCTLKNVTTISEASIFANVSLQGLVISSGEIKRVHRLAFAGIRTPLQALGLPNNALPGVPLQSLASVAQLDRLDLSFNRIKALQSTDFIAVPKLSYLELSGNQISLISAKSLAPLRNLLHLKLNGNRLGESAASLRALEACVALKELDLHANGVKGPLRNTTLPAIRGLEILYLNKNAITSVHNGALEAYPYLQMLSLRNNQIDVLQDHAFSGLGSLQVLDLGHNGIVTISGASLQHLPRLIILDLTHNFLRVLTADVVAPLPALKELRLDGNDISLIAERALANATQLHSLSLENNPLVCDCTMKPFLEWLAGARIASQDILGAICATPPHLEGAALLQLTPESLSCGDSGGASRGGQEGAAAAAAAGVQEETFRTIEVMLKLKNNASYVRDIGQEVRLRAVNVTDESDVHLCWLLGTDDYSCRFVYVFHDDDPETILFNSEVSCAIKPEEQTAMEYIYSTKIAGAYDLQSDVSYKFCLILKEDISKDEYLGACQVATLPPPHINPAKRKSIKKDLQISTRQTNESDISDLGRMTNSLRHEDQNRDELLKANNADGEDDGDGGDDDGDEEEEGDDDTDESDVDRSGRTDGEIGEYDDAGEQLTNRIRDDPDFRRFRLAEAEAARLPSVHGGRVLLEGLGTIIIITSLVAFVWGYLRYRGKHRGLPSMSTCYTADDRRRAGHQEVESRSRYFKLQATTSL